MISLTAAKHPSPHILRRAKQMWCRSRNGLEWIVTPKQKDKVKRLVRFSRRAGQIFIECHEYLSGDYCPANYHERLCGHVERVLQQIEINEKRRQRKAA